MSTLVIRIQKKQKNNKDKPSFLLEKLDIALG